MSDLLLHKIKCAIREANPLAGDFTINTSAKAVLDLVKKEISIEKNAVVLEAAARARANTTAPRIYINKAKGWISPAAEEIAESIEELRIEP